MPDGGGRRVDPAFTAEVKRRMSLAELVEGSGLVDRFRRAGREWKGCCPFHAERSPSFYVVEDKGFFHCFGCGAHGDAIAWIMRTTQAKDFPEAIEYLAGLVGMTQTAVPSLAPRVIDRKPAEDLRAAETAKKLKTAREIWVGAVPTTEYLPVARYLREARCIRVPIPPTLRFHRSLDHPHLKRGHGFPAMVAPIVSLDRKIMGVHCTFLAPDGRGKMAPPPGWPPPWIAPDEKWKPKIMRGVVWRHAIRLTASEPVMVIAEGIETALSVLQSLCDEEDPAAGPMIDGEPVGVWAAGSLGNMGAIELPDGVREVILAADSDGKLPDADASGRTDPEDVIQAAAARHHDQGREVRIARPPAGMDFNDMIPVGAGAVDKDENVGEAA